jgi:transposase
MDLTDEQWEAIRASIPEPERQGTTGRGGRPWRDPRDVLNGILWVLRTGAPWADLPRRYPPPQTCHDRFQKWEHEGVLDRVLTALAEDLRQRGKLDLTEAFIDGTHAGAKRPWQTAMAFLSPSGLRVVSAMKRSSSSKRSSSDS